MMVRLPALVVARLTLPVERAFTVKLALPALLMKAPPEPALALMVAP